MEPVPVKVTAEKALAGITLRRQVLTENLAAWNSKPPCELCDKGLLGVGHEGQMVWLLCPFREETERCRLARADAKEQAREKRQWLSDHGVALEYQQATLAGVDPAIRTQIGAYLLGLSRHVHAGKGLLITGARGVGKTCILGLVAQRAYECKLFPEMVTEQELFSMLTAPEDSPQRERASRLERCRLLLMHEFGAAYEHDFPYARLENLVEKRWSNHRATCITSNIPLKGEDSLSTIPRYQRVIDRWKTSCFLFAIAGESRRETLREEI